MLPLKSSLTHGFEFTYSLSWSDTAVEDIRRTKVRCCVICLRSVADAAAGHILRQRRQLADAVQGGAVRHQEREWAVAGRGALL